MAVDWVEVIKTGGVFVNLTLVATVAWRVATWKKAIELTLANHATHTDLLNHCDKCVMKNNLPVITGRMTTVERDLAAIQAMIISHDNKLETISETRFPDLIKEVALLGQRVGDLVAEVRAKREARP